MPVLLVEGVDDRRLRRLEPGVRAQPGQTVDQVTAGLRADPGFQATQTTLINAFYQQHWHRNATTDEVANIKAVSATGQSLVTTEQLMLAPSASNAFYQRIFGRDATSTELATITAAVQAGQTLQQVFDFLTPNLVNSEVEDGLLRAVYKQVTGSDVDSTTLTQAKTDLQNGAWFADVRYGFAHTDAAAVAADETFKDVLGRSASDAEITIWEDELSDTGTTTSMRADLAQHYTADRIDRIYHEVLGRGATLTELADKQAKLAIGETLGDVRKEVAYSADAVTEIDAIVFSETGLTDDLSTLAEIEAGLAAGATLDSIVSGQSAVLRLATAVSQDVTYDAQGNVTSFTNVLDPFKVARDVAYSFYQTLLGRPPSQDEVVGLKAALSLDMTPSTQLIMLDHNGGVLGQARADTLLTQLPVFITLNGGITPGVQVPGGLALNDGAQVAAFLLGMEGRAGRIDQRTIAIYNEVTSWLDQVGQQLLQLAATMAQSATVDSNADRRAIEAQVQQLAIQLAAVPPAMRAQVASTSLVHRITLTGHQADVSLEIDQLTGQWTLKVHDIDNTNYFILAVQIIALIATAVLTIATFGSSAPLLELVASSIALQVAVGVAITADLVLAGNSFANGDVLGGLLSLASAAGVGISAFNPGGIASDATSAARLGAYVQAARGIVGGVASAVQSAERGNAVGLAASLLEIAASAASAEVAAQGKAATEALKDVGYFLTGAAAATGIADAYNKGDLQGGLMASLSGVLTAFSIASQISNSNTASAVPSTETDTNSPISVKVPILDENGEPLGEGDQSDPGEKAIETANRTISALEAADRASASSQLRLIANGPPGLAIDVKSPITPMFVDAIARLSIDPDGSNFHAYAFLDLVGKASAMSTDRFSDVIMHAVPGGNNDGKMIASGTVSQVRVPVLGYLGTVQTIINPVTESILNVTNEDHSFRYGFVQRDLVQIGNNVYLRTIGLGNNAAYNAPFATVPGPAMATLNGAGARLAFSGSTRDIERALRK